MADAPDDPVPASVAIIMDGNGRWARAQGLPRIRGHEEGARSVREIVRTCRELGVKSLTLYSFSTENWKRPKEEVSGLMALLKQYLFQERDEIMGNGIQLRAIGQTDRLPRAVRAPLRLLCRDSRKNDGMVLCLALSYGGRAELVEAFQKVAHEVAKGRLKPEHITEATITNHLSTAGMPDPDLLIRTSGEMRLSNFLLWQCAYTEIYVTPTAWPDFRKPQLLEAFASYGGRERRYGMTGAQVQSNAGA